MFQDIAPLHYHCEYTRRKPTATDYLIVVNKRSVMLKGNAFPQISDIQELYSDGRPALTFLFCIDDKALFLASERCNLDGLADDGKAHENFRFADLVGIRSEFQKSWVSFAAATALHLANWYSSRKYCGKCGALMRQKKDERALVCSDCGQVEYPKISPVVIVGLLNNDKILLTRYAPAHSAYRKHSLVAGFVEIGETLEDTIRREFMEEVGLHVKNIRYVCSQPWGFSDSLLMGFFADLDGDEPIKIDPNELSDATWFTRDELPHDDSSYSLTWTLIEKFRRGEV